MQPLQLLLRDTTGLIIQCRLPADSVHHLGFRSYRQRDYLGAAFSAPVCHLDGPSLHNFKSRFSSFCLWLGSKSNSSGRQTVPTAQQLESYFDASANTLSLNGRPPAGRLHYSNLNSGRSLFSASAAYTGSDTNATALMIS